MEFLVGVLVGWLAMPYFLVGTIWFSLMFPALFWGEDIYDERGVHSRFWFTFVLMLLTLGAMHLWTPFKIGWLITGDFWTSVWRSTLWILAYLAVGLAYAYLRWFFYVREYYKRKRARLGPNPDEIVLREMYEKRLSRYGSRFSLIMRWILYWPWSALAWALTDVLRDTIDFVWRRIRSLFGSGFGAISRAHEPKEFRKFAEEEKARNKGK